MYKITHRISTVSNATVVMLIISLAMPVFAADFHSPPNDFYFGNHIDTHQENRLKTDKDGNPISMKGSFYIIFTGTTDDASGLPIARHPRGFEQGEDCNDKVTGCVVGWTMNGVPGEAKFLFHSGINGNDHPVWMVNRVDIPQPGSFTHFHWISADSTDPRAPLGVPDQCNADTAGQLEDMAEDVICPGWFFEIRAVRFFAFDHGGEIVPVRPGLDNATHLNLVTNYDEVFGITGTR